MGIKDLFKRNVVKEIVRSRMENAEKLNVPLKAGIEVSKRWGDMH